MGRMLTKEALISNEHPLSTQMRHKEKIIHFEEKSTRKCLNSLLNKYNFLINFMSNILKKVHIP